MEKDMNMQDKEFDDLFRSKLDNFEVEPGAQVWQNVDAELNGKKRKGSAAFVLSIAASIVVVITAGILFVAKKGVVKQGKPDTAQLAFNATKLTKAPKKETVSIASNKEEQLAAEATAIKHDNHQTEKANTEVDHQIGNTIAATKREAVKKEDQQVLATASVNQGGENGRQQPIELETASANVVKELTDNSDINLPARPMLASADVKTNRPVVKRHGIRNFGDLVNLVVAKIDKRKDKLIEFTDNDDDESTITGVHLGAVRIKKDN